MKLTQLLRTAAVAAAAIFAFGTAQAQSPDQQFGVGVNVGASSSAGRASSASQINSGLTLSYAFTPALHVGGQFSFNSYTLTDSTAVTNFLVIPYVRFLFAGPAVFKPFVQAEFGLLSIGDATSNYISVSGGGEYFVSRNLGIYGKVDVFQLDLGTNGGFGFGIGGAKIGVEYFF